MLIILELNNSESWRKMRKSRRKAPTPFSLFLVGIKKIMGNDDVAAASSLWPVSHDSQLFQLFSTNGPGSLHKFAVLPDKPPLPKLRPFLIVRHGSSWTNRHHSETTARAALAARSCRSRLASAPILLLSSSSLYAWSQPSQRSQQSL